MNFQEVHAFQSEAALTRRRLRLSPDARVLLVLASGDWEFGMFRSYGELGILWNTQMEWLEETARVCAANGWHMVVRHHPLGAGKKTYPRASEFLAAIINQHRQWGPHVRIVMPAETLSTYDVMTIANAAVTQFTTGGAEALIRGLPVVCVAASAYRHMGMDWVQGRDDYAAALVRAMNTGPPLSEMALRNAFRYAHFHFYVMGSANFSSVGIKNAYEPDYRLPTPEALQPGVDERMDAVCDHLLGGSPLYPLPSGDASPDQEGRLIAEYREELIRRREAARSSADAAKQPAVTVWRMGTTLKRGQTEFPPPDDWRCRHQEVVFDWMVLDARGGSDAMKLTLSKQAADVSTPYVCFLPEHVTLDESMISQAVDLLELPEHQTKTGALFGCYVIEPGRPNAIGPEWNTPTHSASANYLPPANIPALWNPITVMSLVIWRREMLGAWLQNTLPANDDDDAWCPSMLRSFLDESKFVRVDEPAVIIRAGDTPEAMMKKAATLAAAGDLDAALEEAARIQERFGFIKGLRTQIASWLLRQGRHPQALPFLHAEYRAGRATQDGWNLMQETLPLTTFRKPSYNKDFHSAVDKVFGYMVPGQEKFLHEKVRSLPHDARIIEIGAFFGRSTTAMAFACVGTRRRILSVDTFSGNEGLMGRTSWFYNNWRGNLRRWGLEPYVSARAGYSHPVIRELMPDEMFDFAFIDASHEYADVLLDFELIYPHVRPGGWIGFHDVEIGWPGCWRVWEQTGKRLLTDLATCDTLACGRKQAGVAWRSFEDEWPGFMMSVARYLSADESRRDIGAAMLSLIEGKASTADERMIAQAPEALRQQLLNAIPEAGDDPWLHEVLQLMPAQDTAKQNAAS